MYVNTTNLGVKYWIKVNLHKDGTPLWHGVKTDEELKSKMAELRALDYKPVIDRSVTETLL